MNNSINRISRNRTSRTRRIINRVSGYFLCTTLMVVPSITAQAQSPDTSLPTQTPQHKSSAIEHPLPYLGSVIESRLQGDESQIFTVRLTAGQYINVVVEQRGIDIVAVVYAPNGEKLYEVDSPNGTDGPEPIYLVSEQSGIYRIEVKSLDKTAKLGKFLISMNELRAANERDLSRVAGFRAYQEAILLTDNDDPQAMKKYQAAITFFLDADEQMMASNALSILAVINLKYDDFKNSEANMSQALAIREKVLGPEHPAVAVLLNNQAQLYFKKGEYSKVEGLHQKALAIREKVFGKEHLAVAQSLNNLAELYRSIGDYDRAEPLYHRALAIDEKLLEPEHPTRLIDLSNLALFYQYKGNFNKAEALYLQILALREKVLGTEHPDVAITTNNLARLYQSKGDYNKAERLYKRSLSIKEKVYGSESSEVAVTLNNLASLYQVYGDLDRAETIYQKVLEIRLKRLGPDHSDVALTFNNLAVLNQSRRDYAKAEELYQKSLDIANKAFEVGNLDSLISLTNFALLNCLKGDYKKAEALYQKVITIGEKSLGPEHPTIIGAIHDLGALYMDMGDYDRSEPLLKKSLTLREKVLGAEHPDIAATLIDLARLYQIKTDIKRSIEYQQRGNEVRERELARNLVIGSESQKLRYIGLTGLDKDRTISLHLQSAKDDLDAARNALNIVLRRKGRSLDAMTNAIKNLRKNADEADQQLLDELANTQSEYALYSLKGAGSEGIEKYLARLKSLSEQIEKLEATVSSRSADIRAQITPISIENIQRNLPSNAMLLEFTIYQPYEPKSQKYSEPRYAVYLLDQNGSVKFADLGSTVAIDQAITDFRNVLIKQPDQRLSDIEQDVKPKARSLDQMVMQPVRRLLGDKQHLLIAPDGLLNLVPFDALVDESGQFLIERLQISYLTSGRDLLRLQAKTINQQPPLVIADPDYGDGAGPILTGRNFNRLLRLDGTAEEAASIKNIFNDANLIVREQATKKALLAIEKPAILHIATHGAFLADAPTIVPVQTKQTRQLQLQESGTPVNDEELKLANPLLRSWLFLAGANNIGKDKSNENDSVLTALEATSLNLSGTKLVVLSACETGLGDVKNGEGVYGMRRALVLAGAETQMISLWSIDDNATRELMIGYYKLLKAGRGRGEALREVQLSFLNNSLQAGNKSKKNRVNRRAHPFYWASFIQSGEWGDLNGKK